MSEQRNEERIEAARQAIVGQPLPWDELRQRRVLGAIEHALDAAPSKPASATPWTKLGVVGALVATAAAVLLWVSLRQGTEPPADVTPAPIAEADVVTPSSARPEIPYVKPATVALADGSVAQLHDGAQLDVATQSPTFVELHQRGGRVRYEVTEDRQRPFIVHAGGAEVSVLGTVFSVRYAGDTHVQVAVERGLVQVTTSDRVATLGVGDSLSVAIEPDEWVIIDDDEPTPRKRTRRDPAADSGASGPTLQALLERSDRARATGDLAAAADALQTLVRRFPATSQAATAYFQLGKVQRRRGRHASAAAAFSACLRKDPRGTLAEDARAESAASHRDAGQKDRASAAAQAYLTRYPAGAHAKQMRRILDSQP